MKSIKEHIMFILPLMAMLIGIEFVLVFNRVTQSYENKLKSDYAILVVSKKPISNAQVRKIDDNIESIEAMNKEEIAKEVTAGMQEAGIAAIMKELPYFYRIHLKHFLSLEKLRSIKAKLKNMPEVQNVEIFGESHHAKYSLFRFIKIVLSTFVVILSVVSIFLIVKQMEVWQLAHKKRMRIMEIFGAPLMLRSGVLFKISLIDAMIATVLNTILFLYIKYSIAPKSGVSIMVEKQSLLFHAGDFFILLFVSLIIVFFSVLLVAIQSREVPEG